MKEPLLLSKHSQLPGTQHIPRHKSALLLCLGFGGKPSTLPLRTPVLTLLTFRGISALIYCSWDSLSPGMLVPGTAAPHLLVVENQCEMGTGLGATWQSSDV